MEVDQDQRLTAQEAINHEWYLYYHCTWHILGLLREGFGMKYTNVQMFWVRGFVFAEKKQNSNNVKYYWNLK